MIRLYWGIENGLHYRRDVTLHEDQTHMTKRNAARVMACLNNLIHWQIEVSLPPSGQMLLHRLPNLGFISPYSTLRKSPIPLIFVTDEYQ
jgi:hypothetical protein